MRFENKIVIVTGASIGIGKACALQFAKEGAVVLAVDIKGIDYVNENITEYICDVSDEAAVNKTVEDILKNYGRVDVLVNNAGIWRTDNFPFKDSKSEYWKKKINVNILGTMYFTHAVINSMIERRYGRIINLGSVAGVYGNAGMADYSMTKGAIHSFTVALAKEVTEYGITVNSVSPGNVKDTPESKDIPALSYANRSSTPDEIANVIAFVASDDASWVSGQNYIVDGCRKKL